jgi:thiamine kinase-like enzyme
LPPSRKPASQAALATRVAILPCWRSKVTIEPLHGGLSNIAFVVADAGERFVVRCGHDIPRHHVFRDRERAAGVAAHAVGLSPEITHAEPGILVIRYIDGRTLVEADLATHIDRIVPLLKTCHRELAHRLDGPANLFWVFHVIRGYVRTLRQSPLRPEVDVVRWAATADALEAAQMPLPIVFGHHDLLPGNLIDDGERLWLIDWEYGGFGTAMFDLANLAANGRFGAADDGRLLEAYFEAPVTGEVQRSFDAMKVASALREALWALVSEVHVRVPGVDYRVHANDFFARTELALTHFEARHGRL